MRRYVTVLALIGLCASPPARADDVMALVRAGAWTQADAAASGYADPVVRKLVLFYRLLAPQAASLAELEAFRADSPDWPMQGSLARRRDEALAVEADDAAAIAACDRAAPLLAAALQRCAQAELRQDHPAAATRFAQAAWIAADPDAAWEATFLQGFGPSIGAAQHWDRFARLAWTDPAGAGRLTTRLAPADKAAADAWLALRRDDPAAGDLAVALPAGRRDEPGLVLERLRWLRRASRDAEALALWPGIGATAERAAAPDHKPAFWDERNILVRHRLRDGDPAGAYALAAGAAQSAPEPQTEAAFLAGWIALRKLNDPAAASSHFGQLIRLSAAVITQSRGEYWLGRAAQAAGDEAAASRAFAAAAGYAGTFYGQLAGGDDAQVAARIVAARDPAWDRARAVAFAGRELARAAAWLVALGEPHRATTFLLRLPEVARDPTDVSLVAHLAAGFGMADTAVTLARRAGRSGTLLLQAGWPVAAAIPPDPAVDPALALGIIRQESSFDSTTTSPAGARGLMQLMPGTAAQVGRRIGLAAPSPAALTDDPGLNIRLGTAYLREVMDRLGGAIPLAVAAYNAGPTRLAEWLATNGDPRAGTPDMIDWIELIPFSETRNYVQRVIENTVVYRARLGEKPDNPVGRWPRSPA